MKKLVLSAALCLWLAQFGLAQTATDGSIQGIISDDGGKALSGAYVVATPMGSALSQTSTVVSGPTGAYTIPHLQPGIYLVCAQMPGTAYVNPCHWASGPTVTVTAGKTASSNIALTKGVVLHVRVNDPGQHVAKGEGIVLLGVRGSSLFFHPVPQTGNDPGGMTFEMAIPLNTALKVEASSINLQLADDKGAALTAATAAVPIQQAAGQADPIVTFNVTGKK